MTKEEFIKDCDRAIALIRKLRAEISGEKKVNYIDLGLPSGTLWAEANEEGLYTFDEAITKYGTSLPGIIQFAELREFCKWAWDDEKEGCRVTGPNGNSIFLPAEGLCKSVFTYNVGTVGDYWSRIVDDHIRAYCLHFNNDDDVAPANRGIRNDGRSVRLVKSK